MEVTAKEIMNTKVITVDENAKLSDVIELLVSNNISGAPVVNKSGMLVGMITEEDLINSRKREWAIPRLALYGIWRVPERLLEDAYKEGCKLTAADIMTRKVITAEPDALIKNLAQTMINKHINRIPIVDEDDNIIGIVSRADILSGISSI